MITPSISPAVVLIVVIAAVTVTIVVVPITANISARQLRRWQREGEGRSHSAVFCHEALPGCVVLVAVVEAPLLALASFLLLSPLPFLPLLLILSPPPLRCLCFFRCRFELIVVCVPHNLFCRCCLHHRCCHRRHYCCPCHCCHNCCHCYNAVVALAFVLRRHLILFLLHQLVVACCFASITGIFAPHPSFG
jgi:hypothetical protein